MGHGAYGKCCVRHTGGDTGRDTSTTSELHAYLSQKACEEQCVYSEVSSAEEREGQALMKGIYCKV